MVLLNDIQGANGVDFCIDSPYSAFLSQGLWCKKFWWTLPFPLLLTSHAILFKNKQTNKKTSQIQHGNCKKTHNPTPNPNFHRESDLTKQSNKSFIYEKCVTLLGPEIPLTCTLVWFTHFLTINFEKFLYEVLEWLLTLLFKMAFFNNVLCETGF